MAVNLKPAPPRTPARRLAAPRRVLDWRKELQKPAVRIALASAAAFFLIFLGIFSYFWIKYDRIVSQRMSGQIFSNSAKIYAEPRVLHPGDPFDARALIGTLKRAGYSENKPDDANIGTFQLVHHGIDIQPGPNSYHSAEGAGVTAEDGKIARINSLSDGRELGAYELEPELVTTLFEGEQRSKRRLVRYQDLPPGLVDAILAIEDRRFFQHGGVNFYRMFEAAWVDFRAGKYEQGGSTITMQVARGFFLTPEKTKKRKLTEILISLILEKKFTKQQIFEMYANQVYMGQRGSFTINGVGEATQAYFGKELGNLTLPEDALLAGMIQRPNYYSPYKYPDRALERRNLVLDAMLDTGSIKRDEDERAKAMPLKLAPPNEEASESPYFVDLVKDTLFAKYNEHEVNEGAYRIYTTIDPDLQKAAAEAVQIGLKEVDAQVTKLRTRSRRLGTGKSAKLEKSVERGPMPQVSLIAMDPHTGNVLALVGGRNYGVSQLDHAVSKRPTGSIFKPFVYAAAMNTAVTGGDTVFTPTTMVDDSPTTFTFGDQIYEPRNYEEKYLGPVTLRYALALSLNNATVKLAEEVGYDKVADLARSAGIKSVEATPAMALGSYDATPLDMAAAYTVFANNGVRLSPVMITSLRDAQGNVIENFQTTSKPVLDPRISYVMTDMMQGVLNFGTAAGVRSRGFVSPAAGKTGTSHDAWFAGYTTQLLCIVWVGYDDYSDLRLSGAATAAPIWAEFMKRAVTLPPYSSPQPFTPPTGVIEVKLDKNTNQLADDSCPDDYMAAFIEGTQPTLACNQSAPDQRGFFSRLFGLGQKPSQPAAVSNQVQPRPAGTVSAPPAGQPSQPVVQAQQQPQQPAQKKKKGFWHRLFGGGDDDDKQPAPADNSKPPN